MANFPGPDTLIEGSDIFDFVHFRFCELKLKINLNVEVLVVEIHEVGWIGSFSDIGFVEKIPVQPVVTSCS